MQAHKRAQPSIRWCCSSVLNVYLKVKTTLLSHIIYIRPLIQFCSFTIGQYTMLRHPEEKHAV